MPYQNRGNIRKLPSLLQTQEFIKQEEGLKLTVYLCPAGVKTVGWGHAVEPHDGLKLGDAISEERALQFLESDLIKAYQSLFRLIHVPLTNNQQTALVSFIFNLGAGRFQSSTLRQKLNRKEYEAAAQEFGRWVYARDPVKGLMITPQGLVSRRRREKLLFLTQETHSIPLKPRKDILPFKYGKQPHSSVPRASAPRRSFWQKAAVVFVGFFKAG
jgi:lysozyme